MSNLHLIRIGIGFSNSYLLTRYNFFSNKHKFNIEKYISDCLFSGLMCRTKGTSATQKRRDFKRAIGSKCYVVNTNIDKVSSQLSHKVRKTSAFLLGPSLESDIFPIIIRVLCNENS